MADGFSSSILLSCSNHKNSSGEGSFAEARSAGHGTISDRLTSKTREELFDRRKRICRLLKGDQPKLYNQDQRGGLRDQRSCNKRLVDNGPDFGGSNASVSVYLPAYRRYSEGRFFARLTSLAPWFWSELPASVDVLFVSALYGLLLWDEPIQDYDCHFADYTTDKKALSVKNIWGNTLTRVLCDFLNSNRGRPGPTVKVYDLLSEELYQSLFDWPQIKGAQVFHRIFKSFSGPDVLLPLATILAGDVNKFGDHSDAFGQGWYRLSSQSQEPLEFGFETAIREDEGAARETSMEEEIGRLREQLELERETYNELLLEAERERDEARQQSEVASKRRIEVLEAELTRLEASSRDRVVVPIPANLVGLKTWSEANLKGFVELHSRAFQGARRSEFEDSDLIYRSLLLLKNKYVPMRRRGGLGLTAAFEQACRELGLEECPTFSDGSPAVADNAYWVRYNGRRRLLDHHLKKGSSFEPRYCFRLYFFWDEESEKVVVGWLPSHLP